MGNRLVIDPGYQYSLTLVWWDATCLANVAFSRRSFGLLFAAIPRVAAPLRRLTWGIMCGAASWAEGRRDTSVERWKQKG